MPRAIVYDTGPQPPDPRDTLRNAVLDVVRKGADPETGTFTTRTTSAGGTSYQLTVPGDMRITATTKPRIVTLHEVTIEQWDGQGWVDAGSRLHGLRARSVTRAMAAALSERTAARLAKTAATLG